MCRMCRPAACESHNREHTVKVAHWQCVQLPSDSANDRGFPKEDVDFLRSLSQTFTKLNFTIPDKA
jgi:hypothetical protein